MVTEPTDSYEVTPEAPADRADINAAETEVMPELLNGEAIDEEAVTAEAPEEEGPLAEGTEDEADQEAKKSRRRLAVIITGIGLVILAAVVIGIVLGNPSNMPTEENDEPLSASSRSTSSSGSGMASSGTASSGGSSSGSESSAAADAASTDPASNTSDGGSTAGTTIDNSSAGSSPSNGSPGGSSTPSHVWHEGWDEQVWVDTSSYQSVYVGDNPIYEYQAICSTCGASLGGGAAQHIYETGHSGYSGQNVQIGSTPVYENQLVPSGYWNTIHHEGYWG